MADYLDTVVGNVVSSDVSSIVRAAIGDNSDSFNATEVISEEYLALPTIIDIFSLVDSGSTTIHGNSLASNIANFTDVTYAPFFELVEAAFNSTGTTSFDPGYYEAIADVMVMQDIAPNRIIALNLLLDLFESLDSINKAIGATIVESFDATGSALDNAKQHMTNLDNIIASTSTSYYVSALAILKDSFDTSDNVSLYQILVAHISELAYFGGSLNLDGTNYTFVLNTDNQAISTYTNYNFNSISGKYAADDNGIYELTGLDDNGTAISASLKTGLLDFGESMHKQVPYAYLGLNNGGGIILKTITQQHGSKKERYYSVTQSINATDSLKIKMGKGVKSRYWQFEVMNSNGADFNIDSFELLPLVLKRRV